MCIPTDTYIAEQMYKASYSKMRFNKIGIIIMFRSDLI